MEFGNISLNSSSHWIMTKLWKKLFRIPMAGSLSLLERVFWTFVVSLRTLIGFFLPPHECLVGRRYGTHEEAENSGTQSVYCLYHSASSSLFALNYHFMQPLERPSSLMNLLSTICFFIYIAFTVWILLLESLLCFSCSISCNHFPIIK